MCIIFFIVSTFLVNFYFAVLFMSLLPGVKSQNLVQQNISKVMAMIKGVSGGDSKKKK